MTHQEAADFLVALAQNDYTIDGKMLKDGKTLLDIASWLQSREVDFYFPKVGKRYEHLRD